MAVSATPIPVTGTGLAFTGQCTYRGARLRDTSGAVNTVKIYDGTTASGTILAVFQLAANGSDGEVVVAGLRAMTGLYVSATGAFEGCVRVG